MKREITSYIFAFGAAGFFVLTGFYRTINGVRFSYNGMYVGTAGLVLTAAASLFLIGEYIFFGKKDSIKQMTLRFIGHNIFSVLWTFGCYFVYKLNFETVSTEKPFYPETVLKTTVPSCIQGFLLITVLSAAVCAVICAVRKIKNKDKNS